MSDMPRGSCSPSSSRSVVLIVEITPIAIEKITYRFYIIFAVVNA